MTNGKICIPITILLMTTQKNKLGNDIKLKNYEKGGALPW